jgi:hypothetical protein
MRLFKILSILLPLAGIFAYLATSGADNPQVHPRRGFTIRYETHTNDHGQPFVAGEVIRFVSESGHFRQINKDWLVSDGKVITQETIGDADGVFWLDPTGALELISGPNKGFAEYRSEAWLATHAVRTERFLGYDCYVFRQGNDTYYEERWYSPIFGSVELKELAVGPDGERVKEAVAIDLSEPQADLLKKPERAVQFDVIEQKINLDKQEGKLERAAALEEAANKVKAK